MRNRTVDLMQNKIHQKHLGSIDRSIPNFFILKVFNNDYKYITIINM